MLNNEDEIDEAKELMITRIGASTIEVVEAMEGIITTFQKAIMKEIILHFNDFAARVSAMDKIIDELYGRLS